MRKETYDLMLIDEANSALDARGKHYLLRIRLRLPRVKCSRNPVLSPFSGQRELFRGLVQQPGHGTIIFVTHRLEALQWADKVVVIEDGQIAAVGTPQETSAEVCRVFDLSKDDKYGYVRYLS